MKPVKDRLVFRNLDEDAKALAPNSWKDHFKIYELVDIMRQKDDLKFAQLLNRLRLNELTEEDRDDLRKRVVTVIQVNTQEMLCICLLKKKGCINIMRIL